MPPKRNQKGSAKSSKAPSKAASKAPSKAPSGASTPALREPVQKAPGLLGVNFGQGFSSVAIIDKEGLADCIANDDGERQIASALSFSGSEFVRRLARTRLHAVEADTCVRQCSTRVFPPAPSSFGMPATPSSDSATCSERGASPWSRRARRIEG